MSAIQLPAYRDIMNNFIFIKLFDNKSVRNALIASTESKDDIGVVLRLHLITENFLEAFICSAIGKENLFDSTSKEGRPFKLSYFKKLELASKLGLPTPSFRVLDKFNSLRNGLAHNIHTDFIEKSFITSLADLIRNIDNDVDLSLNEESLELFDSDGISKGSYEFKAHETPNRVKLIILVSSLIRKTIGKCLGFYQLHTHLEFSLSNTNSDTVL